MCVPERPEIAPTHPFGYHRIPVRDRVAALVYDSRFEHITLPDCSDQTIRRRITA